ncbi:MAG: acylphosphatase [Candidatus Altiarchaeales archaeon ex4484_2]|nr:MAG: acylphosphatase [Candidatus Altiarchaeales archaeon ex4484_2]
MAYDLEAHVYVSGRVQGVFYRASTRDKARELGLRGWVRNLPDGRVEALFQGEKDRVEEMIDWCHREPRMARVSDVEVDLRQLVEKLNGFEIRY